MASAVRVEKNYYAIHGGHFRFGNNLNPNAAWLVQVEEVHGRKAITIDRCDAHFKAFVDKNFAMLEHLQQLRNEAVFLRLGQAQDEEDDPMAGQVIAAQEGRPCVHVPKRRRIEMIDEWQDRGITVSPMVDETPVETKVLAVWNKHAHLTVEWSQEVVELLLKEPDGDMHQLYPTVNDPHVKWNNVIGSLQCYYYHASSGKWRLKTMKVDAAEDILELQSKVDLMLRVMQTFHEQHHSEPPEKENE